MALIYGFVALKRFINTVRSKVTSNEFASNVAVLTSGTIAGRAILLLAMPVLTRLYSPADFELLAVYMSLLAIVTVVAALRLDLAIPIIADDSDAINVLVLALVFPVLISSALFVLVMTCPELVLRLLGEERMGPYLWMVPVGILFGSVYQSVQYWTSRKRRFGLISKTRVQRAIGGAGVQVGLGALGPAMAPFGLLFGQVVYNGLGIAGLMRDMLRQDRPLFASIRWPQMAQNLRRQKYFPIYSVPEALLNAAGTQVPILIIAASNDTAEAGFLMLAMQVVAMPLALIGRSVGQVYLAEAAQRNREGTLGKFTRSTAYKLFIYGAPPLIAIGVLAPFLFGLIFGAGWERAGLLVAWSIPWALFQFVASPLSTALHSTGRIRIAMILQGFGLVLRVGLVSIAALGWPGLISETYALSSALFYVAYVIIILTVTR